MQNFVVAYTKESTEEVERVLKGRAFYIGADNKLVYSVGTDILNYVIGSIHKASGYGV